MLAANLQPSSCMYRIPWLPCCPQVAAHVHEHMWRFSGPAMASAAWGLARIGYEPPASFVEELLKASHTKLRALRAQVGSGLELGCAAFQQSEHCSSVGSVMVVVWCDVAGPAMACAALGLATIG